MHDTTCPVCAAVLPGAGADCPRCLLRLGLHLPPRDPDAEAPVGAAAGARATPDPEELARLFPGLEIEGEIGRGGMGIVYRARQRKLGRTVALKLLAPELSGDRDFAARFLREARVLARLRHEHIVAVHDFGETEGLCWILMEHVDGPDLRRVLEAGKLAPEAALALVPQICDALSAAHALGVVHRDIKPENVLLDAAGRAKIADFGLAKLVDARDGTPTLTRAEQAMGTPHYMAPEQMRGARDVDHRADIFSLGVVFYEMLTGQLPIGRFEAPSKRVAVDVRLDEIVLRALESRPERRYQSAVEVKGDVERVGSTPARASAPVRPVRRRKAAPRASRPWWEGLEFSLMPAIVVASPLLARAAWSIGTAGLLLFLGFSFAAGVLAWRRDLVRSPADPAAPPETYWRRFDRLAVALLFAVWGLVTVAALVLTIWERGTPHATPLRRMDAAWSGDAARSVLRRLETYAHGDLPELGEPAVVASSKEWPWYEGRLWGSALAAAGLLIGASSMLLRGRHFDSRGALALSMLGVPMMAAAPLLYGGLGYLLFGPGAGVRSAGEIAGRHELPGYADDVANALAAAARNRGYEVLERRTLELRRRADLAPLARRVLVRITPNSLFERWSLESGGPRRPRPEIFLDALCDVRQSGTSLSWSAGLLQDDAPEEAAWRAEVAALVAEAQRSLEGR
jgi:tRNA A-37 threonylcarbamoyl transferase component Bud32